MAVRVRYFCAVVRKSLLFCRCRCRRHRCRHCRRFILCTLLVVRLYFGCCCCTVFDVVFIYPAPTTTKNKRN